MKLVTLLSPDKGHPGVIIGQHVLDFVLAAAIIPGARLLPSSVRAILQTEHEGLTLVRKIAETVESERSLWDRLLEAGALVARDRARLMAPIPDPTLILSVGTNYRSHQAEMGGKGPSAPGAFIKCNGSIIGTGDAIVLPPSNSQMVDFEGEFCVVIGKTCERVAERDAMQYVAGYTLANDVSARDWVPHMRTAAAAADITAFNQASLYNINGKNFPTFCPLGPVLVTADEIADPQAVTFKTIIDGDVMQHGDTADMIFPIAFIISEFSKFYRFNPGDVITTGSPAGAGMGRKPPRFLRPGDRVTVASEKIGALENPVVAG
jgi:acylpyruvate hydrolase